jgi:hypothetical protein
VTRLILVAGLALAQVAAPQRAIPAAAVGTASLAGIVVAAGSKQPLPRVRVALTAVNGGATRSLVSDGTGRFRFTQLPADTYTLAAVLPGYLQTRFGERYHGHPGAPIVLAEKQSLADLTVTLERGGVIAGTVVDANGLPVTGVRMRALQLQYGPFGQTLSTSGNTTADDRGYYRFWALQPGNYYVLADPEPAGPQRVDVIDPAREGLAATFYPSSFSAMQGTPLSISPGEELAGVDIVLPNVVLASVRGQTLTNQGTPIAATLEFIGLDDIALGNGSRSWRGESGADGKFAIAGVPPGQYELTASVYRTVGRVADGVLGSVRVPIGGQDLSGLLVTLQPAATVSGTVQFRGAGPQPDLSGSELSIALTSRDAHAPNRGELISGRVDRQGRFTIPGVRPGSYSLIYLNGIGRWAISAVLREQRDVYDLALEVEHEPVSDLVAVFSDRLAKLNVTTVDERGQRSADCTVVLFPADRESWTTRLRAVRGVSPNAASRVTLDWLRAGEYLVAAVSDAPPQSWYNPRFLESIAGSATRVSLALGDDKALELRILKAVR